MKLFIISHWSNRQILFLLSFLLSYYLPSNLHDVIQIRFFAIRYSIIHRDLDVPSSSVTKKYDGTSNMAEFRLFFIIFVHLSHLYEKKAVTHVCFIYIVDVVFSARRVDHNCLR